MLVRGVINGALRKIGRLGAGREPRQADQQDALEALQSLYRGWIASGAFGRLHDVAPLSVSYTARPNERVYRRGDNLETVALPALVGAGRSCWDCVSCTLLYDPYCDPILDLGQSPAISCDPVLGLAYAPSSAGVTTPRDGSVVVVVDECADTVMDFLFDGSIKRWQPLNGLSLDAEAPRSFADATGLMACLALEIVDQFGADVPPTTLMQAARYRAAMTSRYSMPRVETAGVYV